MSFLKPRKPPDSVNFRAALKEESSRMSPSKAAELEDEFSGEFTSTSDKRDDEPLTKPRLKTTKDGKKQPVEPGITIPKRRIITLDEDRKLTKAQTAKLQVWKGKYRGRAVDAFFRKQVEGARKKYGHKSVYVGSETDSLVIGIPMYGGHGDKAAKFPGCLPMEFVIANDCFPLGLVWQLVGKHGVAKSGLLAEFGR